MIQGDMIPSYRATACKTDKLRDSEKTIGLEFGCDPKRLRTLFRERSKVLVGHVKDAK